MSAPRPAPRLERIGPYRIESRLGAGGMGEVYRAYDERLDRWVAIKLIRPEVAGNEKALERFRREARAAARLNHPAIVQIHDILQSEEGDAIVMEIVEGPTLAERLRGGPLDLGCALRVALRIAEGLAAAHADGIVHRDLKAENVVLTPAGDAKILDFGVAKRFRQSDAEPSLSVADAVIGTYRAMSPEQARAKRVDHRSDLFSFGTLLYEMLTGRSPFPGEGVFDVLTKICTVRQTPVRELNPELPEPLSDLVDHLLEKDRTRRLQSAQEAVATLERIVSSLAPAGEQPLSAAASSLDGEPTLVDDPRKFRVKGSHLAGVKPSRRKRFAALLLRWTLLSGVFILIAVLVTVLPRVMIGPDTRHLRAKLWQEPSEDALYKLVEKEKELGEIDAARDDLKTYIRRFPDNRSALSWLEEIEPGRGDANEAADILPRDMINPEIRHLRAQLWQEPSEDALYKLVEKEKELGEIDAARDELETYIRQYPDHLLAQSWLGELELGYGDEKEAAKIFAKLVQASPDPAFEELTNLGTAYLLAKSYTEAEKIFLKAHNRFPDKPAAVLNLADTVQHLGRSQESINLYNKVLELTEKNADTDDPKLLTNRAQALARLERTNEAESAAEKALSLPAAQEKAEVWYEASLVFTLTRDYKRAILYAGKALEKGFAPRWFKFPWFEPLTKRKEFQDLLKKRVDSGP